MGKKTPMYVVFNMSMGNNHHTPVATGDDLDELLVQYHGKAYQVMAVKPVFERVRARSWLHELVRVP